MDDNVIICRCEEITLGEIKKAIQEGATTVDGIKRITRAGKGLCQGRTCRSLVENILASETKKALDVDNYPSIRPPVRVIKMSILSEE